MKNLLVAQSGGPTSAINATLAGVIENALSSPSVDKIYGSVNGIQGVLNENLIDLKTKITNVSELDLLLIKISCRFLPTAVPVSYIFSELLHIYSLLQCRNTPEIPFWTRPVSYEVQET